MRALIAVLGAINGIRSVRSGGAAASAASWWIRVGVALGVTFLMTIKPDLIGSVVSVVLGGAAGWAVSAAISVARKRTRQAA